MTLTIHCLNIAADSGRFGTRGCTKTQTAKLHDGERILQRFQISPSCLEIVNEGSLLFKIQSTTDASTWYHVSLQSNYCDYPDWST